MAKFLQIETEWVNIDVITSVYWTIEKDFLWVQFVGGSAQQYRADDPRIVPLIRYLKRESEKL